jgi:hypothetical protein
VSFIVKADDKSSTFNDKIITIKKINEVPVWKHMVLEASNYQYIHDEGYDIASDASFNTEEWYSIHDTAHYSTLYVGNSPILPIDYSNNNDDVSHTFNVRYYNPAKFNGDTSYYILDLSSLDPEGFDVCYEIHTANNDYLTHDWSWNLHGSKVYIKVPGEDKSNSEDLDFSFEIISHDNNVEDVSGFVPTDYYSFNGEDVSKRIVNFHKEIPLIELLNVTVVPTTDEEINYLTNYYKDTYITDNFINKTYSTTLNSLTIYLNNPQITSNTDISYTIKYNFNKTLGYDLEYTDVIINQSNVTNIIDYTTSGSDSDVTLYFSVYGNNTYDNNVNENFQLGININSISRTLNIKLQHYIYIESAKLKYNNVYVTSGTEDPVIVDLGDNTIIDLDAILSDWNANTSLIYTGEVVFKHFIPDIIIPIQNLSSSQSDNTITASENINNFLANHTYNGQINTFFPKHEITIPFFNTNKIGVVDINSPADYQPTNITSGIFLSVIAPYNNYKFLSQTFTTTSHNTAGNIDSWASSSRGGEEDTEWRGYKVKSGESANIYIRDILGSDSANNVWIWHTKKGQDGGAGGYGYHDPGSTWSDDRISSGGGGAGGVRGAIQSSWNGQRKSRVIRIEFTTTDSIKIYYGDNTQTDTVIPQYQNAANVGGNAGRDVGGTGGVAAAGAGSGGAGAYKIEYSLSASDQFSGGHYGSGQAEGNVTVYGPDNENLSILLGNGGNGGDGAWGTHMHGNSHGRGHNGSYNHSYGGWGDYNRYVIIERINQ